MNRRAPTPYEILQVGRDATISQIMTAYGTALRKGEYSPQELARALHLLRNPEERAAIDLFSRDETKMVVPQTPKNYPWPQDLVGFSPEPVRVQALLRPAARQQGGEPPGGCPLKILVPAFVVDEEAEIPEIEWNHGN